jgi:hypothetical protein
VVAVVTSARLGSNVNYWLEASAWLALAIGMHAPTATSGVDRRSLVTAVLAGALAVDAVGALRHERARWSERPYLDELVAALARLGTDGDCAIATYPELAASAGRTPYFNDVIQYMGRAPKQYAVLRGALAERTCAALVLPFPEALRGYARVPLHAPASTVLPAHLFRRASSG